MSLSAKAVEQAKPGSKTRRIFDSRGFYVEVTPSGAKYWRLKYRFEGREKRLALGVYPEVSLKEARSRCDEARKLLANGIEPSASKRAAKVTADSDDSTTFKVIGHAWFAKHQASWSEGHRKRVFANLRVTRPHRLVRFEC